MKDIAAELHNIRKDFGAGMKPLFNRPFSNKLIA
jgi:hypothetical protein